MLKKVMSTLLIFIMVFALTTPTFASDESLYTVTPRFDSMFRVNSLDSGLCEGGLIFGIDARNAEGAWSSFCGYCGSKGFANTATCDGYLVAWNMDPGKYAALLSAFNYINNKYHSVAYDEERPFSDRDRNGELGGYYGRWIFGGGFNEIDWDQNIGFATRIISQITVWHILCDVALDAMLTDSIPLAIREAILDVHANGIDGVSGDFNDLVYLVCRNHTESDNHAVSCQPQVFPIRGKNPAPYTFKGSLNIEKTVNDKPFADWLIEADKDAADIIEGISFDLYSVPEKGASYSEEDHRGSATLSANGEIAFKDLESLKGWYAIVESFTEDSLAEKTFQTAQPLYIEITGIDEAAGCYIYADAGVFNNICNESSEPVEIDQKKEEADSDPDPDLDPVLDPEPDPDLDPVLDPELDPDLDPDPDIDLDPDHDPDPDPDEKYPVKTTDPGDKDTVKTTEIIEQDETTTGSDAESDQTQAKPDTEQKETDPDTDPEPDESESDTADIQADRGRNLTLAVDDNSRQIPIQPEDGHRLVQSDKADTWIELDENGAPLGEWRYDNDLMEWVFEEYPAPLGNLPRTGDYGATSLSKVSLVAILLILVISAASKKGGRRLAKH